MKLFAIASTLLCIGFILIVLSLVWTTIIPNDVVWSKEQATRHTEASMKLHNDTFDQSISRTDLQKSKDEFAQIDEKLQRARSTKNTLPIYMRWAGCAVTGLGVVLLLVKQSNENKS